MEMFLAASSAGTQDFISGMAWSLGSDKRFKTSKRYWC